MGRIMAIVGHPQDPFERAGGTAARHLERGDEVMFVTLTSGVVTHAFGAFEPTGEDKLKDIDKVKDTKRDEFDRAARGLGITDWRFLDFPESPMLFGQEHYVTVVDLIREFRPEVVLCPHPVEVGRHDHMDAGRFVVAAVDYTRAEGFPSPLAPYTVPSLYMFYYLDFSSDQLMGSPRHAPDLIVDITPVISKKREAMAQFGTTQAKPGEDFKEKLDRFMERVDGNVGHRHGVGYAEQFVSLTPRLVEYLPLPD